MARKNGNPDIWKYGFDRMPENINRKGQPKKSLRLFNDALQAAGVKPLTKQILMDTYEMLFNAPADMLKDMIYNKPDTPMALKIIYEELQDKKKRHRAFMDLKEWRYGKAAQEIKVDTGSKEAPVFNIKIEMPKGEQAEDKVLDVTPKNLKKA